MMNQNKKNSGWILCSSKSFPGKFYYFNVVNGEAAWSLNDVENQTLRRDYRIHKIADKSHTFPEPSSPPMDDTPNMTFANNTIFKKPNYNTIPKRVINNTQTPMFGQAIFPKYFEPYMPNIIWTPIQLPHPMYVSNTPDMGIKMPLDRIGQSIDPDRSFVQTCDLSLSKRFEMYARHITVNKMAEDREFSNKFYDTSTPIKSSFDGKVMDKCQIFGLRENVSFQNNSKMKTKTFLKEPVLKKVRTRSESDNDSRIIPSINKTNSAESLLNIETSSFMKSTSTGGRKVENSSNVLKEKVVDLDRNDLRFLLVAKRRKSVDLGDLHLSSEGKKIKTSKEEVPKTTTKKRVTFDLGDQVSSDGLDDRMEENIVTPEEDISPNVQDIEDGLLYIAVDIDTLLDEYEFIEEYTQSDDNRRLLIPHKLQAETEAVCLGDCRGRQRVIAARQITRRLVNPPPHYVILPESEDSPNSVQCFIVDNRADNYILNTCLQVLNAGDQVMLITNNADLYNDAKTLNIDCFKPQELKDGAGIAKPEVSFDLKKVQITVPNQKNTNLFLQMANDFEPYLVKNKEEIPANSFKKRLFDGIVEENNIKTKLTFKDANTSPIDTHITDVRSDRLIDITRKKQPCMPQIDKFDNPTNEIGLDLQNLFIKEKQKKNVVSTEKQNADNRFKNGSYDQRRESKQKVSQPEISDRNSLDDILSVYSIKNKEMEENIKLRLDEWICCFTQIMENAMVDVLLKHRKGQHITEKVSSHWVLYESIRTLQELYGSHTEVNLVTEKFKVMLINQSSSIGKIKSSIKPNDFVKIVGCGMLLIETLKSIEPSSSLQETSNSLNTLLQDMSQPTPEVPMFTTPILTNVEHETVIERRNYVKKPSEIIEYLKTHFPDWKDFQIPPNCDTENPKVVRTFGRDLNLLKIDKNKSISLNTRTKIIMKAVNDNTVLNKTQTSTKIDGITATNDEKLPKPNSENDIGNTKIPPIVFRKFDSSFICRLGYDKNKPTSTKDDINITENIMFISNNEAKVCDMAKTIESKAKIPNLFTNENKNAPKINRLFDNLFKQNDNEIVATTNNDVLNFPKHGNTFQGTETAGPKVIRTFDNLLMPKTNDKPYTALIIDDLNVPKHGNTFNQENETAGPKVIRNIKPIEAFEGKLKENTKILDLDALDYSETENISEAIENDEVSTEDTNSVSFVYAIRNQDKKPSTTTNDKNVAVFNDNAMDNENDYTRKTNNDSAFINDVIFNDNANDLLINDSLAVNNDSDDKFQINDDTNDSGFENESIHAYSLVKIFLAELSESVKAIYEFIVKSINEFRKDDNQEEKRRMMHEKANKTHLIIAGVINKLKRIIQRESNDVTSVRGMLLKAGVQASSDKRMTRYRQVVTKCLEQAQILENALKTVLALTDDVQASNSSYSDQSDTHYYNIFE